MLTIPLEKLAYIITKAREFDVEVPPVDEDSGSNPSDDAEWDVLQASADNPTYQELVDAINGLNDPERIELLCAHLAGPGRLCKGRMAGRRRRSTAHSRRKGDPIPGWHPAACRLPRGRAVAAGLLAGGLRNRPHVAETPRYVGDRVLPR